MIYHNAVKRILSAPIDCDRRSAERYSLLFHALNLNPRGLSFIKIHGESGKSASATMLSHALTAAGYKTGTVTTPFSHGMTECIAVDGKPISLDGFAHCVSRVLSAATELDSTLRGLSFPLTEEERESLSEEQRPLYAYRMGTEGFSLSSDELLLSSAILFFAESGCQLAVLEVPTGVRANAYRMPQGPLLSVVTSTADTDAATAICASLDRRSGEVVCAMQEREIARMIADRCAAINCRLTTPIKKDFYLTDLAAGRLGMFYRGVQYALNTGAEYQAVNLLTVIESLSALKRCGLSVDPESASFQPLYGSAGVPLQFAFVSLFPTILTDFADSPTRFSALAKGLSYHESIKNSPLTLLAEESKMSDDSFRAILAEHGLSAENIVQSNTASVPKAVKPLVKTLQGDSILLISGSRPFVYEAHRALIGLLP